MSDILSQDEVDALLKAVAEGAVPAGDETTAAGPSGDRPRRGAVQGAVQGLDLTNQERSLRGRLPGLDVVVGRFVRTLRGSLGVFFGQVPDVDLEALELVKFGPWLERLPQPMGLQIFRLGPLRGQGMVVVQPPLLAALLQVLFGGAPDRQGPAATPAREFSAIEQRVLERLGTRVLQDFRDAWQPVVPLECTFQRTETNRLFAAIAAPHELVLHLVVRVRTEACEDGALAICIPNAALDPIRQRLQRLQASEGEREADDGAWGERLRAALAGAGVEVTAELGTRRLMLREVLALRVGDVIGLGTGREGPVVVKVAGRTHFLGAPGVANGNNAVRITARI